MRPARAPRPGSRTLLQAIELDAAIRAPRRLPLPICTASPVPPGVSVRVLAHPAPLRSGPFCPDRLIIDRPADWAIRGLVVRSRGRSNVGVVEHSLVPGIDLASARFGLDAAIPISPRAIAVGDEVALDAEYLGRDAAGAHLTACLLGTEGPRRRCVVSVPLASARSLDRDRAIVRSRGSAAAVGLRSIAPGESIALSIEPSGAFFPDQIFVEDASSWTVDDVTVGGSSILLNVGGVPGDLLDDRPGCPRLDLGIVQPGDEICVSLTNASDVPREASFELSGPTHRVPGDGASALLSMSSGQECRVLPDRSVQVTSRFVAPEGYAFLPERIVIARCDRWVVHRIMVGMQAQLLQGGDLPSGLFSCEAVDAELRLDLLHSGVNLEMTASYVGPDPAGESLRCGIAGRLVVNRRCEEAG